MSDTKTYERTSGKWTAVPSTVNGQDAIAIIAEDGEDISTICECLDPHGYLPGLAMRNMRLCAAAPALLEALQELVTAGDECESIATSSPIDSWQPLNNDEMWDRARAAIAAATGEEVAS